MAKFQLVLFIHAHQPVGNFEEVLERAYAHSYRPFLEVLERHPSIRLGLHYSGALLEWMERAHAEYFDRLRHLVQSEQIEIAGGGFYEPILIAIPPEDRREQIARMTDYVERHFGQRPRGAWLAERVWEPELPSTLAPAGIEYTLVDDNHFLAAGIGLEALYGYYLAEDLGSTVKVLPGLKALRYLIPFRIPEETIQFLRNSAREHPGEFAAMGDDLEKFGVWPGTHKHCYEDRWLENFFSALEANGEWLETLTPGEAVRTHKPKGRADLPTASYGEMMEWALPTQARNRYHALAEEFSSRPDCLPFLRGGIWRNFFSKYSEANLLHKKMLHVSEKIGRLGRSRRHGEGFRAAREEARRLLLRSQCNDAYWHGIFGGLYSPHLRAAAWQALARSEALADGLLHRNRHFAETSQHDFDLDGSDEIYLTSDRYAVLIEPHDGGTAAALDFRATGATVINSMMRRPEAYHTLVKNLPGGNAPGVQSIHGRTRAKEDGLERWLNYDRWPRHAFRLLLFGRGKNWQDYAIVRLEEDAGLAGGSYRVLENKPTRVALASEESEDWPAEKIFQLASTRSGFEICCDVSVERRAPGTASVYAALEMVVNFLAPAMPDRYFESAGQRYPLRWGAAVPASELQIVDEWQGVRATLAAPGARDFWIAPIETVSESEDGFERIYQGSQVLAVWPVEIGTGEKWEGRMALKVERVDR